MSGPPKYLREESPCVDVAQRQNLMLVLRCINGMSARWLGL